MDLSILVLLFVIGSTIWVTADAKALRIPSTDKPYSLNNGAFVWFLACVFIWIFTFPVYLARRAKVLRERDLGLGSEKSE